MTISVTIDSCVWNYFFTNDFDLSVELPSEQFSLYITREVEIELLQIPDISKHGDDKRPFKDYVRKSIGLCEVETTAVFGFAEANVPGEPARCFLRNSSKRKSTSLGKNEADVSLAVASFTSVLITADKKENASSGSKGPIHDAAVNGGRVLYLQDFGSSGSTLGGFIEKYLADAEAAGT
ncbi:hypothetical protein ACN1C3_24830 [Pseudomonas sp. H11T01]|uniref:hypothetical protein n=1 Tax=Pseudomonas sp. H11T01 TaxID=3402749 RepID=UPI003ABF91E9